MPRILKLSHPYRGLSSLVNVIQRVGPREPNAIDDVRVVQELVRMMYQNGDRPPGIPLPEVTGRFDAVIGFYIYYLQWYAHQKRGERQIIDGVVSPAHGATYGPHGVWTIASLNAVAKDFSPDDYAQFVARWSGSLSTARSATP